MVVVLVVALVAGAALASGHKLALRDLAAGHDVRKYGEVIGRLTAPVCPLPTAWHRANVLAAPWRPPWCSRAQSRVIS